MESFIVRIYRRHPEKSESLVGTVEFAGQGERLPFRTPHELLSLLRVSGAPFGTVIDAYRSYVATGSTDRAALSPL